MRGIPVLAFVAGAVLLSACGDEAGPIDPSLDPISVVQVDVTPAVDTIFAADTIRATDQLQLAAVIMGRVGPITSAPAIWFSEDSSVATVSATGLVRPRKYGVVRVVASASKKGYASIAIAPAVTRVTLSPSLDTILVRDPVVIGDVIRLTANPTDASGSTVTGTRLVWTSSDPTVATVDSTGVVRAIKLGRATITSSAPSASVQGTATVLVAPRVRRVEISPLLDTLFVEEPIVAADTRKFSARLFDEDGFQVVGTRTTWTSSNAAVGVVDSSGLFRALTLGSATVTARSSDVSGVGSIVVAPVLKAITLTSPVAEALALDTIQLTATAVNYSDAPLAGRTFVWQSSNPAVATVNASGRVISVGTGTVTITARSAFRSAAVTIAFADRRLLAVEAGGDFSCGTTALGRLYCWGRGDVGQTASLTDSLCFDETFTGSGSTVAGRVGCALAPKRSAGTAIDFRVVATGGDFACGVSAARLLYCWGQDKDGQIGNGSNPATARQPLLATVSNVRFDSLSAGGRHACALTATGSAYCWGNDSLGQLGDRRTVNSTTPIPVFTEHRFRSISAGGFHTCGLRTDGIAMCWGSNNRGQLGIGSVSKLVDQPSAVTLGGQYASISAGFAHTCAIATDGRAFCWGDNTRGQLGIGSLTEFVSSPTAVVGGLTFGHISAGGYGDTVAVLRNPLDTTSVEVVGRGNRSHTCALTTGGAAYCWGDNYWRQSGLDDATDDRVLTPNSISPGGSIGFRTISVGSRHACAYSVNGQAWCWGSNVFGALGNELQAAGRSQPQLVVRPR